MAFLDAHDVTLREPLGNRKLVDGATGRPITWISSRLVLRLTSLPAEYRLSELIPAVKPVRMGTSWPAGCMQTYTSRERANQLTITQSTRSGRVPGSPPGGGTPVVVRGHPGLAHGNRLTQPQDGFDYSYSSNQITWREDGLTDSIQSDATGTEPDAPPVLSPQRLIAIADSAQTYSRRPVPITLP